jgi:hypothetical protein
MEEPRVARRITLRAVGERRRVRQDVFSTLKAEQVDEPLRRTVGATRITVALASGTC